VQQLLAARAGAPLTPEHCGERFDEVENGGDTSFVMGEDQVFRKDIRHQLQALDGPFPQHDVFGGIDMLVGIGLDDQLRLFLLRDGQRFGHERSDRSEERVRLF